MFEPGRRLVTGINTEKQSVVLSDEKVTAFTPYPIFPCFQIQELFYTEDNPQSLETRNVIKPYEIDLPKGAMRFMKIRMPTKKEMIAELRSAGEPLPDDWTTFNLHSTDSVDYAYVISGQITCVVGKQLVELKQGDFLAQIGPEHTWINDNSEPCYLLCIMVGIEPSGERKKMMVE